MFGLETIALYTVKIGALAANGAASYLAVAATGGAVLGGVAVVGLVKYFGK